MRLKRSSVGHAARSPDTREAHLTATPIDGRAVAAKILRHVRDEAQSLGARGLAPHLVALQIGSDPEIVAYLESQRRHATGAGVRLTSRVLALDVPASAVLGEIEKLGRDPSVHGILVPLPLPASLDAPAIQAAIDPQKDVEGVSPSNLGRLAIGQTGIVPCTADAVLTLLDSEGVPLRGAEVVVVGHSVIVGKPVALLLLDRLATVTLCHAGTRDLFAHTRRAEVLVVAVGKPGLMRGDAIRPGAIVIDVGTTRVKRPDGSSTLVGDVVTSEAMEVASRVTPVPGGVGPVTVAILMRNVVSAATRLSGLAR